MRNIDLLILDFLDLDICLHLLDFDLELWIMILFIIFVILFLYFLVFLCNRLEFFNSICAPLLDNRSHFAVSKVYPWESYNFLLNLGTLISKLHFLRRITWEDQLLVACCENIWENMGLDSTYTTSTVLDSRSLNHSPKDAPYSAVEVVFNSIVAPKLIAAYLPGRYCSNSVHLLPYCSWRLHSFKCYS